MSHANWSAIAATWPGPGEKPTVQALKERFKTVKRQVEGVKKGNFTAPTTPRSARKSSVPQTPAKTTATPTKTASAKRQNTSSHHSPKDSATKKRRVKGKKSSDEESEAADYTSSVEDTGDHQEESEDEDLVNSSITKRELPARSKSRSKSYVAEADSAGEDAGAKDPYSDDDAEFSLDAPLKGNPKARLRPSATRKDGQVKSAEVDVDDATDEEAGLRDEEEETDAESRTTAGKSHQTYFSAEDEDADV